jgi:hypothetical protein
MPEETLQARSDAPELDDYPYGELRRLRAAMQGIRALSNPEALRDMTILAPDTNLLADRVASLCDAVDAFRGVGDPDTLLALLTAALRVAGTDQLLSVDLEDVAGRLWMVRS